MKFQINLPSIGGGCFWTLPRPKGRDLAISEFTISAGAGTARDSKNAFISRPLFHSNFARTGEKGGGQLVVGTVIRLQHCAARGTNSSLFFGVDRRHILSTQGFFSLFL